MSTTDKQRRKSDRNASEPGVIRIALSDRMGNVRWITADLANCSDSGIGISLRTPLTPGSTILVRGKFNDNGSDAKAAVMWCAEGKDGVFKAGLELVDKKQPSSTEEQKPEAPPAEVLPLDLYEIMQLSPNADTETITRVYRILASRYHPDNTETGDPEMFVQLTETYRILSDPEKRAGYDAQHRETKRLHWKIFDQAASATGVEAERRKRLGILGVLHSLTLQDPDHSAMSIRTFEELLGVPREHLESALWYLRGKGYIQRADNGRYTITVLGFDKAEEQSEFERPRGNQHLLEPASL
jgi:curved DNA-binding protein